MSSPKDMPAAGFAGGRRMVVGTSSSPVKVNSFDTNSHSISKSFGNPGRLSQSVYLARTQRSCDNLVPPMRKQSTSSAQTFDLFSVKKQVEEELQEVLVDVGHHVAEQQAESHIIAELTKVVTEFIDTPPDMLRNGFSSSSIMRIKDLLAPEDAESERMPSSAEMEYLVRSLFLISSCARLESMMDSRLDYVARHVSTDYSESSSMSADYSPETSPRPMSSPRSPRLISSPRSPRNPHTPPLSPGLSFVSPPPVSPRTRDLREHDYSSGSDHSGPSSPDGDRRHRRKGSCDAHVLLGAIAEHARLHGGVKHVHSASLPELNRPVQCRICEREVPVGRMVRHSRLCIAHNKWELKSLEIDDSLVQLLRAELANLGRKTADDLEFLKAILDIVVQARSLSVTGDRKGLDALSDKVSRLRKKEKDETGGLASPRTRRLSASPALQSVPRINLGSETSSSTSKETSPENQKDRRLSFRETMQKTDSRDILMGKKRPTRLVKPNPRLHLLTNLSKLLTRKKTVVRKMIDSYEMLPNDHDDKIQMVKVPSISDFEILKPITRGGYSSVYLAQKKSTGDILAIKVLKKDEMVERRQVDNVKSERDILATTSCPFVVRLYYAFKTQENLCLAMEYLCGGDLCAPLIELGTGLAEDTVKFYIAETIQALEYLHGKGIIHRDLKPDNMLIANDGHLKLTDFGLSHFGLNRQAQELWGEIKDSARSFKLRFQNKSTGVEVQEERVVGTPDYLAPEVLLGLAHGISVDYWALGVITFELLTGIPPFSGADPAEIFDNILNRRFCISWEELLAEGISPQVVDLMQKLLKGDAKDRLGTNGAEEVKAHPWFAEIDWENLRSLEAGFKPNLSDTLSTEFFEARQKFWPMIEEDFGFGSEESGDASTSLSSSSALDLMIHEQRVEELRDSLHARIRSEEGPFGSFWCINALNLHERNIELYEQHLKGLSD
eukprot:TRINITY_DN5292_c1_g1_i1.p1 TRINITY_DN5292_c1_g1~~TRINITY_DN5292_c1_g1_i1.p1  ORF type:complete len:954 (-),score=205.13 TRINITY_DN5292_c1_g1_i1:866-3727(-)